MRHYLKMYSRFFIISLLFICVGLIGMLFWEKGEATLSLNGMHNEAFDQLFKYITWLGEWLGAVLVGLFLLVFKRRKDILIYLIALFLAFGSAQGLKRLVFDQNGRPAATYQEELHEVEGVKLMKHYSFPSGHTTGGFVIFGILAFVMRKNHWQWIAAILACLVGVSRMYLGQHYLMDVVAGACLGTFVASLVFFSLDKKWNSQKWNKRLFDAK